MMNCLYPNAITDLVLVKQAILQTTLAMCEATFLPWPAVRAAWASSMHEDGTLTWANSTQWAINRLSASQIALAQLRHSPSIPTQKDHASTTTTPHVPMKVPMALMPTCVHIATIKACNSIILSTSIMQNKGRPIGHTKVTVRGH